jgi:hypothetical protein
MYVKIFYNTKNPRDKVNKFAKRSRAKNPPNIAGSLQVNGALRSDVAWSSSQIFLNNEYHPTSVEVQDEEQEVDSDVST